MADDSIRNRLIKLAEEDYRKFISSLLPGVEYILGVRQPQLQKLAGELSEEVGKNYIRRNDLLYLEEIMLQGILIGRIKADLNKKLAYIQNFIPRIDNWAVCDSFCAGLKFTKSNREIIWEFLQPYLDSDAEFEIRFGVVMLLCYYVEPEYIEQVLNVLNEAKLEYYYVKMAVAWAVSVCYVKFPQETEVFLKNNSLDDFTHNKSIRKIIESNKIDDKEKEKIRGLTRRRLKKRE